jgi:hypothetical protein
MARESKREAREPKSETNPMFEWPMLEIRCIASLVEVWDFGLSPLGFVSDFALRISCFGKGDDEWVG